jgi:glycosyltransferase involved in cell wall biosynthesis
MDSMTSPHILLVYNGCWYVWNARRPLIAALKEKGYRITVLAPRDGYSDRLAGIGVGFREISMDAKSVNPFRDLATFRELYRAYQAERPQLILHYTIKPNIYGSIAARFLKIPAVNNVTGLGAAFEHRGPLQSLVRMLYRFAFAKVPRVFFQNGDDKALFLDGKLIRPEQADLLPGSGVNPAYFAPRPRPEGPFTFLFVGRMLKSKGVEEYIRAAGLVREEYPQTRFLLVGPYDEEDPYSADYTLMTEAARAGTIELPGPTDEIRDFLAAADCVVLPSRYREGVPRSLLEAASMAKPLIAADSVGTREPVTEGLNGYLCRPGDYRDLAQKMLKLRSLSDAELATMGAASRAIIESRFNEEIVINKYREIVDHLIKAHNSKE